MTDNLKLNPEILTQYGVIYEDDNGKVKINCPQLAKFLLNHDDRHYIILRDNQEILMYNGSYFENNVDCILGNRINYYLDYRTTNRIKTETIGFFKHTNYIEREALNPDKKLINLQSGILDIETKKIIPHDPKYTFQYEIPINYDENADCPLWKKFLTDVLYQDDLAFIQEFCGYLLLRDYRFALLVILLGHGRNGKTVFINTISEVLGEENVEHIPLQTIAHERFAKAKLYQKHANLCSELGAREINDTGAVKELTGNDMIFARDLYKSGFKFRNFAKLMFACNILPDINDKTLAMSERLAVLEFPNEFKADNENCDPNLLEKLTTENEKKGIFNWMVEGLESLLKKNKFSTYRDFENVSEYIKANQDPVKIFVDTYIEKDPNGEITKEKVYNKYLDFCKDNNHPHLVSNWFSQKFKPYAPRGIEEGQPRIKGHKQTWKGIKFKDGDENTTDNDQEELNC